MASEKSDAIVLRLVEWSETSLIVTLLTRELGKRSAVAKGARRPKSSFEGALDLLAICRVVIIPKSGDVLDVLTEAKLERRFRSGSRSLERLYAGYYFAELLRELIDDADPHPEVFDMAQHALCEIDGDADVRPCLLRFELQLLRMLGHAPILHLCSGCGIGLELAGDRGIAFGSNSGGVVCDRCRTSSRGVVIMRNESCRWMRNVLEGDWETSKTEILPQNCYGELRGVMSRVIADLCGGPLRSTAYLKTIH